MCIVLNTPFVGSLPPNNLVLIIYIYTDYLPVFVIVSSIWTNRALCALYKTILDLLDEESVSRESSGRASLQIRREVPPRMFEKLSRSLKYDSIFLVHKHMYYIYIWTPTPITLPPLALRMRCNETKATIPCNNQYCYK